MGEIIFSEVLRTKEEQTLSYLTKYKKKKQYTSRLAVTASLQEKETKMKNMNKLSDFARLLNNFWNMRLVNNTYQDWSHWISSEELGKFTE